MPSLGRVEDAAGLDVAGGVVLDDLVGGTRPPTPMTVAAASGLPGRHRDDDGEPPISVVVRLVERRAARPELGHAVRSP